MAEAGDEVAVLGTAYGNAHFVADCLTKLPGNQSGHCDFIIEFRLPALIDGLGSHRSKVV
ncbi:hypothetical protein D3C73_1472270 [compost metagenome]